MNLWHSLEAGPKPPHRVFAVVEVPKGSRNKYKYHGRHGFITLDRVLYSAMRYPGDYGFVPHTLHPDGSPLDVLVMTSQPTFPGCVIEARPLGLLLVMDRDVPDSKILAVPATDPLYNDYSDISHLPPHFLKEVAHFFSVYKDLEGVRIRTMGWEGKDVAHGEIADAIANYDRRFPPGTGIPDGFDADDE